MHQWLKHMSYGLAEAGRYLAGTCGTQEVEADEARELPQRPDFAPGVLVLATDQGWREERERMDRRRASA